MNRLHHWWIVPLLLLALCLACGSKGAASTADDGGIPLTWDVEVDCPLGVAGQGE